MVSSTRSGQLHGLLVIDKPAGWTSHDVVSRVRRLVGEKKVGHAGTLDPMATGVLPVAVGDATRALEYLAGSGKRYEAEIVFGVATDTLDADGVVTHVADASSLCREQVEAVLATIVGTFEQIPPMHAAIKINGKKLYELARQGIEIERPGRTVSITAATLLEWNAPIATVDIACSKGFYVRSFARDLGAQLGCPAHLGNLIRTETGAFSMADTWTLNELGQLSREDFREQWTSIAVHPGALFGGSGVIVLSAERTTRWLQGLSTECDAVTDEIVSVYAETGEWLGAGRGVPATGQWQPEKVVSGDMRTRL